MEENIEIVIEHNPLIKICSICNQNIGIKEPYYRFSEHWKNPKAKVSYVYTCDKCGDRTKPEKK